MSAELWNPGIYTQLDPAKNQIRLLQIESPEGRDPTDNEIKCHLMTVSLDDDVEFDTLSYTWGDYHDRIPINLNRFEFPVTNNLYSALKSLRHDRTLSGYLWVDSLCINQDDLEERGCQVSIMGAIFRKARIVHIWLGLEGQHSVETTETFKRILSDGFNISLSQISKNVLDGIEDLISRAWWSRVWVIPEASAAMEPLAHLGTTNIPFRDLLRVLREFVMKVFFTESAELSDERRIQLHRLCDRIFDVYNSFNIKDLSSEHSATILDVLRLLNSGGRGQATDPRDRVYALLGILPPSIAIRPDYTTSVETLYRNTTMRLMTWRNSLEPLCRRSDKESKDLPSWVADLRCCSFQAYIYQDFKSSLDLLPAIEERGEGQLHLYAKVIDYIGASGERCPEVESISGLGQDSFEAFYRVLKSWYTIASIDKTHHSPTDSNSQSFWRTVVQNSVIDSSGRAHPYSSEALGVSEIQDWLLNGSAATSEETYKRLRMSWVQNVGHVFFTTRHGRFGVTQGSPLQNDVIALLAGSKCPFILRPVLELTGADQCYKLVGACYCDGVMYGEAVTDSGESGLSGVALDYGFQEATLV